jgi:hypothetical protein
MKNNIVKVAKELKDREYLMNSIVILTVNYEKIIDDFRNPTLLKDLSLVKLDNTLKDIEYIKSYNLTVKLKRGINNIDDYDDRWKSVSYTFWSGLGEIDNSKYGKFEWMTLGDRESLNGNNIRNILCKYEDDGDDCKHIKGNHFEYDKVGEVIDNLIELDILLDKQYE